MTFYGVRGSTPCSCDANRRYGGNTACVSIDLPGVEPIVFDLGTGLRFWGATFPADVPFRGHALVTHLHWDHVQGLPFFAPVLRAGTRLDVYAPPPESTTLEEAFDEFMSPPYFPVRVNDLPGELRFHPIVQAEFAIGDVRVVSRSVPHIGPTNGYRVERDGVAIAYISDHQQPFDGTNTIPDAVLELCEGADLVVHDAQYTASEFLDKAHWGHCTVDYAVRVAAEAGARCLALFHHDPEHDDETIDAITADARRRAEPMGLSIVAASEGRSIPLGRVAAAAR
ncbi:MAG TPA: MBL fold metallo-hydrolase [Acidimicrobiales bacterium]|nr:MBL fold metallo-hydrolase [Acidimicrobiales bacterium]